MKRGEGKVGGGGGGGGGTGRWEGRECMHLHIGYLKVNCIIGPNCVSMLKFVKLFKMCLLRRVLLLDIICLPMSSNKIDN